MSPLITVIDSSSRAMRTLGGVEVDARPLVVGGHPPGAEAELEPAVAQHVDGRGLGGEHDRMLVVVAEHERADAQRLGARGRVRDRPASARAGGRRSGRA